MASAAFKLLAGLLLPLVLIVVDGVLECKEVVEGDGEALPFDEGEFLRESPDAV
jgi:hypothetical protein